MTSYVPRQIVVAQVHRRRLIEATVRDPADAPGEWEVAIYYE